MATYMQKISLKYSLIIDNINPDWYLDQHFENDGNFATHFDSEDNTLWVLSNHQQTLINFANHFGFEEDIHWMVNFKHNYPLQH